MSSPPESVEGTRRSKLLTPRWWWPLLAGVLFGIAYRLLFSQPAGHPYSAMMSSFTLLVPALVGAVTIVTAESTRRRSWAYYFWTAAGANGLLVFGALALSIEGLICSVLAVPLFAAVGGTSGLLTGALCRLGRRPRNSVYGLAILPLVLGGIEQHIPLPDSISTSEQSRHIAATPEQVWARLLSTAAIRPQEMESAWMYRIGVPLPLSAQSEEGNGNLVRHVKMGKDIHFDQIATDWEPGHRVLWTYRFTEDSFPPHALDDHVRIGGRYFDVIDTEYVIEGTPQGSTLHVTMHYRVSTTYNWYVLPIAHFLVVNFEQTALAFYAHRAESQL
jgi:uncharacterized protein YndB with AHSA1/START domain